MPNRSVSPREASELLAQGHSYVDVRSIPEFEAGHPPGAVNIPIAHRGPGGMTPNPEFAATFTAKFPARDAKVVVGCKGGGRTARATGILAGEGYTALVEMPDGWDGWAADGLPVEK